jgi:hypothetical protein
MRFFIPEQVVSWLQKMVGKLATAEYNKNDYVIAPARNTEGGGFRTSVQA